MARFGDPGTDDEDLDLGSVELEIPDIQPEETSEVKPEVKAEEPPVVEEGEETDGDEGEDTPPQPEEKPAQQAKPKNKTPLKKRVDELTFKYREQERQAQQYAAYAAHLEQQLQEARTGVQFAAKAAYENDLRAIDAEIDKAERDLITAEENGDIQSKVKANRALAQLAAKRERTEVMGRQYAEPQPQPPQQYRQQPAYQQPRVQPASKAVEFAERHSSWFGVDQDATAVARQMSVALERKGVSPQSAEHYQKIEQTIRSMFPELIDDDEPPAPQPTKPRPSVVAGVGTQAPVTGKLRLSDDKGFMDVVHIAKEINPNLNIKDPAVLQGLYKSYKKDVRK